MKSPNDDCAELEQSLGSFVLGSLDPVEQGVVVAHLSSCSRCSRTTFEFASMPAVLNQVDEMDLKCAPPQDVLIRTLASARAELAATERPTQVRSRTHRYWLALGVSVAAAAVIFGVSDLRSSSPELPAITAHSFVSATNSSTGVSATADFLGTATGTQVTLSLNGVPPEEHCQLVVVGTDGRQEVAATWVATYAGEAQVTGTTSLSVHQIVWFNVVTVDGRTLLRISKA